jgi:hypothetical protein
MSELIDWCRKEAARNARMQGDKEHQTNQRRKTFRHRNHMLIAVADRIEELENALTVILPMAKGYAAQNNVGRNQEKIANAVSVLEKSE